MAERPGDLTGCLGMSLSVLRSYRTHVTDRDEGLKITEVYPS